MQSLITRRLPSNLSTVARRFASHGPKPETPAEGYFLGRLPGQQVKKDGWEIPYYVAGVISVVVLGFGLVNRPQSGIEAWARDEMRREDAKN